jgi:hypothetical protein
VWLPVNPADLTRERPGVGAGATTSDVVADVA